jgi:hypothetical protein
MTLMLVLVFWAPAVTVTRHISTQNPTTRPKSRLPNWLRTVSLPPETPLSGKVTNRTVASISARSLWPKFGVGLRLSHVFVIYSPLTAAMLD